MIDLYKICHDRKPEYMKPIDEHDWSVLHEIFDEYEKSTGHVIDEYGDSIIRNSSLGVVVNILSKHSSDQIVERYYKIMLEVYHEGCGVLLAGD